MKTVELARAEDMRLGDLVKMTEEEQGIIVATEGDKRYIFTEVDEFEWEVFSLSRNREFLEYLRQCRERGQREGHVPLSEIERIHSELLEKEKRAG